MKHQQDPILHRNAVIRSSGVPTAPTKSRLGDIVGAHPSMLKVFEQIRLWAPTSANIVIAGETGVGKELVAHALHSVSARAAKPFIVLDCSTLSRELLESELFGHEKGAFTGAVSLHLGRFERANGGTLFIDEIANMSPEVQSKLLRVLQNRTFERIGGNREIRVDVRIIAASNRPLRDCVAEGKFREDLYHRLNTGVIEVPPLHERASDIPLLAAEFLQQFRAQYLKDIDAFTPEALVALTRYKWPGNVRELRNVVERSVILCGERTIDETILPPHIAETGGARPSQLAPVAPPPQRAPGLRPAEGGADAASAEDEWDDVDAALRSRANPAGGRLFEALARHEQKLIGRTLREFRGNVLRAAAYLGVSRTTMYKKMQRYSIDVGSIRR
ncbi:MAG TPA: sigma-54 dependent transcriptional regulator [Verrucomicrobiae bacterium]|nr:sigma-54 dependent transcriptional regulator [Verrucomicrobiae bacterium]